MATNTQSMDKFEAAKQSFLEGLRLLQTNELGAAEVQFSRSLELIPDRVSTLNNLSAIKLKLRQFAEAEQFALKATAVDDKSQEAWSNLCIALMAMARLDEALQVSEQALHANPASPRVWLAKAMALLKLARYEEALQACEHALKLDSSQHELFYTKSLILKELKRQDEAQKLYQTALDMRLACSPVFIGERCVTQRADALIVNREPILDGSFRPFEELNRFLGNFPSQLVHHLHEDFHFTYLFCVDPTKVERKQIPQPDFVINNHVNGEVLLSEGNRAAFMELVDSFRVPVVNHPAKAVATTRDLSAKLLEGIPGVRVPKTLRFSRVGKTCEALLREIEEQYDYPLIARPLASQEGRAMTRVDSREMLLAVLAAVDCPEKFFVTEFVDSRGGKKFFRKIRATVVKDEIIIVRADYDTFWKIYGRKSDERVAFYLNNAHLLEEEKRICEHPEEELGRSAIQSLVAIRKRVPLDVFGIDFDVDADGTLVFYEANATMNLFSTARAEVPYPKDAAARMRLGFQRYFTSLVERR